MLQEKIVYHMLDHTSPIRIDSVPINLKETYKLELATWKTRRSNPMVNDENLPEW